MKRMSLAALQRSTGSAETGMISGPKRRLSHAGIVILLGSLAWWNAAASVVTACPFCSAPSQTWSEMVAEADVLIHAKLLSADDGSTGNPLTSVLKVQRIHKGAALLPENGIVTVPDFIFAPPGARVLLKASRKDLSVPDLKETFATDDQPTKSVAGPIQQVAAKSVVIEAAPTGAQTPLTWDFSEQQSEAVYRYVVEAPAPDQVSVSE